MRRKQNENNKNYLPDKNSFAALFTFEVETFQRVKLFNLTTKLVVKHFRNWVTKISAISDESLPFPPPLFLTFGRLDLLLVACWPARDSGACCWRGCVIVAAPLPAPALAAELAASLSSTDSNKSVWNCFKLLSSHPVKKQFFTLNVWISMKELNILKSLSADASIWRSRSSLPLYFKSTCLEACSMVPKNTLHTIS